jgi:hypothetical protein
MSYEEQKEAVGTTVYMLLSGSEQSQVAAESAPGLAAIPTSNHAYKSQW